MQWKSGRIEAFVLSVFYPYRIRCMPELIAMVAYKDSQYGIPA